MRIAGIVLRIGVAIGVLGVLFTFVPLDGVATILGSLHPAWFVAGLLLQYVLRGVATVRMKIITDAQGMALDHLTLWQILLTTHFYSTVLPGPLIGGGATWLKYVQHGATRGAAGVAILLNRGVALGVMVAMGAVAWLHDSGFIALLPAIGLLGLALLLPILLALPQVDVHAATLAERAASSQTTPRAGAPLAEPRGFRVGSGRVAGWTRGLLRRLGLFSALPLAARLLLVGSSVVHELAGAAVMWCFAQAAGLELPLLTVLWMRAALQLVLVLPVTIAGLGLREASLVGLCAVVGVPATAAVGWSLTIFLGSLVIAVTGGLVEAHGLSARLLRRRGRTVPHGPAAGPGAG